MRPVFSLVTPLVVYWSAAPRGPLTVGPGPNTQTPDRGALSRIRVVQSLGGNPNNMPCKQTRAGAPQRDLEGLTRRSLDTLMAPALKYGQAIPSRANFIRE